MNETDTIDVLRAELADRHLARPAAQVVARGRLLRARRRRPYVVAAVAVLGAAGVSAVTTIGGSPPAFADWSATPETAPPVVVAAIDAGCRALLGVPADAELAVVDRRGANAVAVYTSGAGDYQCALFQGSGGPGDAGWWTQGGGTGPEAAPVAATPLDVVADTAGTNVHEGAMTAVSGRVRADVARVTASVSGRTIEGALGGGTFDVWWPAVGSADSTVVVTASAADGSVLQQRSVTVPGFGTG